MNKRQLKKFYRKKNDFYTIKKYRPKKRILKYNQWLVNRYPFLRPHNRFTDKVRDDYFYEYTELDSLSKGWRKAFGLSLCEELRNALIETNYLYEFRFMQIKEKYGQARIYCGAAPKKVFDILHKYEELSYHYCEHCGKSAQLTCDGYWYETICKECWDKRQRDFVKRGYREEQTPYNEVICEDSEEGR